MEPSSSLRSLLVASVCALFLLQLGPRAEAQIAQPVADLRTDEPGDAGSFPTRPTRVGNRIVFAAYSNPDSRSVVWATDGTTVNTVPLLDHCPGGCFRAVLPHRLLWTASLHELWSTDGTRSGTLSIPMPWRPDLDTAGLAVLGTVALFPWFDEARGWELWRSDGTVAGTHLVVDLVPGAGSSRPLKLLAHGSEAFFLAATGPPREPGGPATFEIWKTDGSEEGTRPFATAPPGFSADPNEPLAASSESLFFTATAPESSARLASVPLGGGPAVDLLPQDQILMGHLRVIDRFLYFYAHHEDSKWEVWRTDGTPEGTRQLTDLEYERGVRSVPFFETVESLQGVTFFLADPRTDGIGALLRVDPRSDRLDSVAFTCAETGDAARLFHGIPLIPLPNRLLVPARCGQRETLFGVDERGVALDLRSACGESCPELQWKRGGLAGAEFLVFIQIGEEQVQLWRTDGTPAGTRRAASLEGVHRSFDFYSLHPVGLVPLANGWVFSMATSRYGEELWFTDGTTEGSRLVADLNTSRAGIQPASLSAAGSRLVFTGRPSSSSGPAFYGTAGGPASTEALLEPDVLGNLAATAPGSRLALIARSVRGRGVELWASVGTSAGTSKIADFPSSTKVDFGRDGRGAPEIDGYTYFRIDTEPDRGVWRSDGTSAGTTRVFPTTSRLEGQGLLSDGAAVYFVTISDLGRAFWRLQPDETTASGVLAEQLLQGTSSSTRIGSLARIGDGTYFLLCDEQGSALWRSDGQAASTRRITNFAFCTHTPIVAVQGGMVFHGSMESNRRGLFFSDGTAEGTRYLGRNERFWNDGSEVVSYAEGAIFAFESLEGGSELWRTDGTAAGTELILEVYPGFSSSVPDELTVAGSLVYFVATDPGHGRELWVTDGTSAGTRLAHDLNPGAPSSAPSSLTVVGDQLYFAADDGLTGRELWVLPLGGGPACKASATALCLQDGRFRVEARWRDFQEREGLGRAVSLTPDTGYFWFFNQANVEAVVKVLDGRPNNGHFWTFYGALSNVEYHLTVTEVETGLTRRYFNPSRKFASVGDTRSFGPLGASLAWSPEALAASVSAPPPVIESSAAAGGAGCAPSATRLCLQGGRFAVDATWRDFRGREGVGTAVAVSGDTGYFWFFDEANVETMVKVLDGRVSNGNFWVFYGALSNVDYDLTVTDTTTGQAKTYQNRNRAFASVGDTRAFAGS